MNEDLLVRVLVNYQLLAPYGEHWVYDTPLFGLCLEATRNTDTGELQQWRGLRGAATVLTSVVYGGSATAAVVCVLYRCHYGCEG